MKCPKSFASRASNIGITIRSGLFLAAWAGRGGGGAEVPAAHNSKTVHGIEMKFGRIVENHKFIN